MGVLLLELDNDMVNEGGLIQSNGMHSAIMRDANAKGKVDIPEIQDGPF